MLKRVSLRWRVTLFSMLLLAICCCCLTVLLNLSANQMADVIAATPMTPAIQVTPGIPVENFIEQTPIQSISTQTARTTFLRQSIGAMVGIILTGGALTYYLSGKVLQPLQTLSQQMAARTVHNLTETLPVPASHDEVATLTVAFNEMSTKLGSAFAMQQRFAQSAAHELRTPLTIVKTKIAVFNKKAGRTPEEYEQLLTVVNAQTERLAGVVHDLLNLTNMDATADDSEFELADLVSETLAELTPYAHAQHVQLHQRGGTVRMRGNSRLMQRALGNLLENAIHYNNENGEVVVWVGQVAQRPVVTITDSGIGIPKAAQAHIFEPFYRVDKSRSRQNGGAGLGLATVKAIVEQHQGTITVQTSESGGSCFTITF